MYFYLSHVGAISVFPYSYKHVPQGQWLQKNQECELLNWVGRTRANCSARAEHALHLAMSTILRPGLSTGITQTWEICSCLASHQRIVQAKCAYLYSSWDRQTKVAAPSSRGFSFWYGTYMARRHGLPLAHSGAHTKPAHAKGLTHSMVQRDDSNR